MSADKKLLALVVEDMADLAFLMVRELEKEGWQTIHMDELNPAVERIKNEPYFHLVFLDLNLPGSTPMETIARIPEILKYSPVRVISGYESPEIISAVLATGAEFIHKMPAPGREPFLTAVVRALGWYRNQHGKKITENLTALHDLLQNGV